MAARQAEPSAHPKQTSTVAQSGVRQTRPFFFFSTLPLAFFFSSRPRLKPGRRCVSHQLVSLFFGFFLSFPPSRPSSIPVTESVGGLNAAQEGRLVPGRDSSNPAWPWSRRNFASQSAKLPLVTWSLPFVAHKSPAHDRGTPTYSQAVQAVPAAGPFSSIVLPSFSVRPPTVHSPGPPIIISRQTSLSLSPILSPSFFHPTHIVSGFAHPRDTRPLFFLFAPPPKSAPHLSTPIPLSSACLTQMSPRQHSWLRAYLSLASVFCSHHVMPAGT